MHALITKAMSCGSLRHLFSRSHLTKFAIGAVTIMKMASVQAAITDVHVYDLNFSVNPPGQPVVDAVINVGDTIRWVWDEGHHSTTAAAGQSLSWNSGVHFAPHEFEFTFTLPGVFNYYCLPHGLDNGDGTVSGMSGSITVVSPSVGIDRADSIGQHDAAGRINVPLNLAGQPASDPRLTVNEIFVVFGRPVRPSVGDLTPEQVIVTSSPSVDVPPYTVSFGEGGNIGQELTLLFSQPLPDQHRYRISFENFADADGQPLSGDTDFEFRVLQGDANNNGAVTATDVSFVRSRINETAGFGATSRADVNMSGSVTGPDVSFVRSRIGHSAP